MDFIRGFPKTRKQHDSIMVVVDKFKEAHFILVKYTCKVIHIIDNFMKDIFPIAWNTKGDHIW